MKSTETSLNFHRLAAEHSAAVCQPPELTIHLVVAELAALDDDAMHISSLCVRLLAPAEDSHLVLEAQVRSVEA